MGKTQRTLGLLFSGLALAIGVYMAHMLILDGTARYILTGAEAVRFSGEACAQIAGCKSLKIDPGYDWRNAARRVIYRLDMNSGSIERTEAAELLLRIAGKENGVLGWTLKADSTVDLRVMRQSASDNKRKGGER